MLHAQRLAVLAGFLGAVLVGSGAAAQDGGWQVAKASGEVWLGKSPLQQASLTPDSQLRAGETIRTGRNGRALLTRGEETMLLGPNSEVALPADVPEAGKTTILERAGSITLEVEKKNVPHFEVVTPYLAAVVKGTQFTVTVDRRGGSVAVSRGQVQVADYKSGQHAIILPGQAAKVAASGFGGLSLSGNGVFNKIEHGQPRTPPVKLSPVPKGGFSGPAIKQELQQQRTAKAASGTVISAPIGDLKMNFSALTKGLARPASAPASSSRDSSKDAGKETVWSAPEVRSASPAMVISGQSNSGAGANALGSGASSAASAPLASAAGAPSPATAIGSPATNPGKTSNNDGGDKPGKGSKDGGDDKPGKAPKAGGDDNPGKIAKNPGGGGGGNGGGGPGSGPGGHGGGKH